MLLLRFVPVLLTPLMLQRTLEQWREERPIRLEHDWVSLDRIAPSLALAVVCAEDQHFPNHHGFDLVAIRKALDHNQRSERLRGASTISQQTAKNVFLWPARSWLRKGLETYFTLWLELLWSKRRILEVYLNVVEFGDGIYGAEAAARHFFGRSAAALTREQAAALAAALPQPRAVNPASPGPLLRSRQAWVLNQMRRWGNRPIY